MATKKSIIQQTETIFKDNPTFDAETTPPTNEAIEFDIQLFQANRKVKNDITNARLSSSDVESKNFDVIAKTVIKIRSGLHRAILPHRNSLTGLFIGSLFIIYWIYFIFAVRLTWHKSANYCDGVRFLFIITVLSSAGVIYHKFIKRLFGKKLNSCCLQPLSLLFASIWKHRAFKWVFSICLTSGLVVFFVLDSQNNRRRLVSLVGIVTMLTLGYLFSKHPGHVVWRKTLWGLGLQFFFALIILRSDVGRGIFQCLGHKVTTYLAYTDIGSAFIYGYLVTGKLKGWDNSTYTVSNGTLPQELPLQAQLFAFKVLPVLFFFSFCISILYYYGIMQWIVKNLGWLLQVTVGTTPGESINSAAAIFVGQTEAPLVIKPYLSKMTMSELHAVMAGGYANIAGSTLAAYISFGINPSYLISASIMSAPAALGYAKLLYPETEKSKTNSESIEIEKGTEKNVLEAAANGASLAVPMVANIAANLISFIAFVYFINGILAWMGSLLEWDFLTLEWILSKLFEPLAFIMGVEWEECDKVAKLIGMKTVFNEYIAYAELSRMLKNNELSHRAQTIATYALCGFANISSIGIQMGCLGSIVPERKADFALVAVRALVVGATTNFITACVAGSLIDG